MSEVVSTSLVGDIAMVRVDKPPVNAMDQSVRAGLYRAFSELRKDAGIRAIIVFCAGRTFVAGADIKEFESGIGEPGYHQLFRLIEDSPVPVIAAIHGTALGAGVELALACHYRVADEKASLGLPELSLGIIPGAGGTQRMPRVIPFEAATEMMLSGRPLSAIQAQELGLVDRLLTGDLVEGAREFAQGLIAGNAKPRRTRERAVIGGEKASEILKAKRDQVSRTMRNRQSPLKLLDVLQAAAEKPFDQGLEVEKAVSSELERTAESRALRHLFFAEREVRKIPGLADSVRPRTIERIGIVGAGTMGSGIAMTFANAGLSVTLVDSKPEAIERAQEMIRQNYERSLSRGSITADQMKTRLNLITYAIDFAAISSADLIVEAVFEVMDLKKEIFSKLDEVAKTGAILATNTSTLDINVIGRATKRPQDVIGFHFFSPANVMRLLEIVRTEATGDDVLATALKIAATIRKVGVVSKVCYGFIGNRMMDPYGREAERCLLEGATPEEVDSALEGFGMAMGILAVFDMAGVDVGHLTRVAHANGFQHDPTFYRPSAMLTERGWLGQKAGRGYYRYDKGKRVVDPEVVKLLHDEAERLGVQSRKPSAEEICERCFYGMINEGARIIEEGIALRASDIDVVYTSGYGFPRHRGGPMFYADTIGLKKIYDRILEFQHTLGSQYWQPAPLLKKLAMTDSSFGQWQAEQANGRKGKS
jgi:3-hydroxyacyl-CoA dehydrogenase